MRPKKVSNDDILSFLSDESKIDGFSDDSDIDKTWQPPVLNKANELDESECSDTEIGEVSDLNIDYFTQISPGTLYQISPSPSTLSSQP
jgi:hypothetical protein